MLDELPLTYQLPSEVRMQPCDIVAKCPLPCMFYKSFKMFKISACEFGTGGACTNEYEHAEMNFLP